MCAASGQRSPAGSPGDCGKVVSEHWSRPLGCPVGGVASRNSKWLLAQFQARKHLRVDGVVGGDTWRALGIVDPVVDEMARVSIAPNANDGPVGDRILEAALILAGMPAATARAEARAAGLFNLHAA